MNFLELFKEHQVVNFEPIKKIEAIEYYLKLESGLDNIAKELPLRHHIVGTKYAREIFLNKGILLVSKIHNFDHISVISQGEVSIYDINGETMRLKAPCTWIAEKGMKRLIYVHEDTVWTTFHELSSDLDINTMSKDDLTDYIARESDLNWISGLLEAA